MLKTIIAALSWVDQKGWWLRSVSSYLFGGLILWGVYFVWGYMFYGNYYLSDYTSFLVKSLLLGVLFALLVRVIIKNLCAGFANTSFFADILTIITPFVSVVVFSIIWINNKDNFQSNDIYLYQFLRVLFFLGLPFVMYSLLTLIESIKFIANNAWFKLAHSWSRIYNVAFISMLYISIPGFFIFIIWNDGYYDILTILIVLAYLIGSWILSGTVFATFYGVLRTDEERDLKRILTVAIGALIIGVAFPLGSYGIDSFQQSQIEQAREVLQEDGYNKFGFDKVRKVAFLESSFVAQYEKQGRYFSRSDKELFTYIFDDTLEGRLADKKVNVDDFSSRRSDQASILAQNENAAVLLDFAQYDTVLYSESNALETTVTYQFQNTKDSNQEVVFDIRLPKSQSVVTDLKLGLNLELQGVVAPRGAAERVYRESLRKQIDPALIAQIGPNVYRLRVYPVLSVKDTKSQGRQKVQIKYITPMEASDDAVIAPAISVLNLRITDDTKIVTRLKKDTVLLSEDIVTNDQREYLAKSQVAKQELGVVDKRFCQGFYGLEQYVPMTFVITTPSEKNKKIEEEYLRVFSDGNINSESLSRRVPRQGYDSKQLLVRDKKFNETVIFFDISSSAQNEGTEEIYQEVVKVFRDRQIPIQIQLFNFDIYPATANLRKLEFWGYTDTGTVIDYLNKNKISGKRILIVTDDSKFDSESSEAKDIDYKMLNSNVISVLQVGNGLREFRDELTRAVLASGGNVAVVNSVKDVVTKADILLRQYQFYPNNENCIKINDVRIDTIQAGQLSDVLLSHVQNNYDWRAVADKSAKLAQRFGIVNMFASYIALETDAQKRDLDKYSGGDGRYDTNYENFGFDNSGGSSRGGFGFSSSTFGDESISSGGGFSAGVQSTGLPSGSSYGGSGSGSGLGSGSKIGLMMVITFIAVLAPLLILRKLARSRKGE